MQIEELKQLVLSVLDSWLVNKIIPSIEFS
jgi:hypothetical protein